MTCVYLSEDSITVEFDFEGMLVALSGTREAEVARGTYLVKAGGGGVADSGNWRLTWKPLEK